MLRYVLASLALLAILNACSESSVGGGDGPNKGLIVETMAVPSLVVPQQAFTVSCPVIDAKGKPVERKTRFTVDPEVTPVGQTATPTAKGTYKVACSLDDGSLKDPTPAMVYVLGPEDMERVVVETTLSAPTAPVGTAVQVSCSASLDGTVLTGITTEVHATPQTGITVTQGEVTGTADGVFQIACGVTGTTAIDKTPAELVVGKGNPAVARVTTQLSEHSIASGDSTNVKCTATDSAGNVLDRPTVVSVPAGVAVVDHVVTGQQAGTFTITCKLADDAPAVELVSDELTVEAGKVAAVEAYVEPAKEVYKPGDKVTVKWKVTDSFGNEVPAVAANVSGPATGVKVLPANAFELLADGIDTFTVELQDGSKLKDTVDIIVDGSGPLLKILTPDRGQTFDGPSVIHVTGTVSDAFGGVKYLKVNGAAVSWNDTNGEWAFNVDSEQALNIVVAEAEDTHGNKSKATVAWYYSTDWATMDKAKPDLGYLKSAIKVWLSQQIIDDGDHTEAKVDDLAHLLEIILGTADFSALLGKPVLFAQDFPNVINIGDVAGTGVGIDGDMKIWADIGQISFGKVALSLTSRQGGIDLKAKFLPDETETGMTIGINAHAQFDILASAVIPTPFGDQTVTASLQPPPNVETSTTLKIDELDIDASFDVSVDAAGELQVVGKNLKLTPVGIDLAPLADADIYLGTVTFSLAGFSIPTVDLGIIDLGTLVSGLSGIVSSILNPILNTFIPLATNLLEPLIAQFGGQAIQGALKSLEVDQTITVPELVPGQPSVPIEIKAKIADVAFTKDGGAIGLSGLALSDKKVDRNPLGSILRDGCLGADNTAYVLPKTGPMEFALALDLLNEVLFSDWWGAGLNMTIDASKLGDLSGFGVTKANILLQPLLPPVMSDCNAKGTLKIQLGDSYLEADLALGTVPVKFKAWLSAEIDIGLVANGNQLGIVVNGVSQFQLQVFDVEGPFAGLESTLEELIQKMLLEQVLGKLTNTSLGSFPLPEFDLGGLVPGVPAGTKIALGDLDITKKKGFLQIEGNLK